MPEDRATNPTSIGSPSAMARSKPAGTTTAASIEPRSTAASSDSSSSKVRISIPGSVDKLVDETGRRSGPGSSTSSPTWGSKSPPNWRPIRRTSARGKMKTKKMLERSRKSRFRLDRAIENGLHLETCLLMRKLAAKAVTAAMISSGQTEGRAALALWPPARSDRPRMNQ